MASYCEENLTREEAKGFIRNILCEEIPTSLDLLWINKIIQAFHRRIPYQNVTLLSQSAEYRVPSWRDICKDIIKDGKGGLCLSLNIALAAVLRAFGIRAYTAAADYVATRGRGVHVVVIIDFNSMTRLYSGRLRSSMSNTRRHDAPEVGMHTNQTFPYKGGANTHYEEERTQTSPQKNKLETCLSHDSDSSHVTEEENGLYLADVGCGFPTLTAVNLKKDVGKVFMECCLEYRLVKKGRQFIRMHRTGDCIPEGEEVMSSKRSF
ncbi:uncharacterized protein LOC125038547 [Penaeus chinensis]|uniref:uncharacterized protein LOC125038547 n=1 Tax=Penaeus chinensis TaxID=139456 RepID=UPI001FB58584|nr:uncharacterized protein LOC125038547 [Penaeus chinensis]